MFHRSITAILLCAVSFLSPAQSPAEWFRQRFNAQQFDSICRRTDPRLIKAFPDANCTAFLSSLFSEFGTMTEIKWLSDAMGWNCHQVSFSNHQPMLLKLAMEQEKFTGIDFSELNSLKPKTPTTFVNPLTDHTDSIIDVAAKEYLKIMETRAVSVALIVNGKTRIYHYGEMNSGSALPPDDKTPYEIGSVSKTFCGTLLSIAIQEGKVNLDDDIRLYLGDSFPVLQYHGKPVRLRHLITHTAGLDRIPTDMEKVPGYDSLDPYKSYTREMIVRYLRRTPIHSEPGTQHEYSTLGFALLGMVLENAYHMPYNELLEKKFLKPNGMLATWTGNRTGAPPLQGHNSAGDPTPAWHMGVFAPGGGLVSTITDMAIYTRLHLEQSSPELRQAHQLLFDRRENISFGWFNRARNGYQLCWHSGATFGFVSFTGFIREKGLGLTILSNACISADRMAIAILDQLAEKR